MAPPQGENNGTDLPSAEEEERFDAGSTERRVEFGNYLLMGKIARGGMAEIYRARPATGALDQLMAIKCMRPHLAREGRFVEMFIREGKLAMLLRHDGIVHTFEVGDVDGRYFISMEYIAGKDLNAILRRCQETGRRVPLPHAIYIASKVCEALGYAHSLRNARGESLNIVNRDVSPSNIRISYEGAVKLLDFGIAQAVLQASSEIGILKGKFSYMSPEQVRGLPLDHRTDIFSTGIMLHEMLTCERLFRDDSEFVLMEKVRRAEVKPPSTFNKRVPEPLDAIVMRALHRDLDGRYQDTGDMRRDLEELLQVYNFTSEELGEFVRGLFATDFRADLELVKASLSPEPSPAPAPAIAGEGASPSEPRPQEGSGPLGGAGSGGVSPPARAGRSAPGGAERTKRRSLAPREARHRNPAVWGIAITLLVIGILILILALR